jgi:hypothetical protein
MFKIPKICKKHENFGLNFLESAVYNIQRLNLKQNTQILSFVVFEVGNSFFHFVAVAGLGVETGLGVENCRCFEKTKILQIITNFLFDNLPIRSILSKRLF